MAEKKAKPEIPQPRTDVIFPGGGEDDAQPPLRPAPPGRQAVPGSGVEAPPPDGPLQAR